MSFSLSPPLGRALAVAILLLLPLLAWVAVAQPMIAFVATRQSEIDNLSDRLARLQAAIRRIPVLEQNELVNKQRLEAAGGIWTNTSEAVIASIMQDRLRQAVAGGKGVVKSASHTRGQDEKDLQTVRIRFNVEGTLDTVQQALALIDATRPAIFVDNMTIAAPATFTRDKPPILTLDVEVVAYMRTTDQ